MPGLPLVTQPERVWEVPALPHTRPSTLLWGMYGEKMPTEKSAWTSWAERNHGGIERELGERV